MSHGDYLYKQATLVRTFLDEQGRRRFVPFRVDLDVQLTPSSTTTDTLPFFLYQENAKVASRVAYNCFLKWYKVDKRLGPRDWPKPTNKGITIPITDKEYAMRLEQARRHPDTLRMAGDKSDPVAFHEMVLGTRIILPQGFSLS